MICISKFQLASLSHEPHIGDNHTCHLVAHCSYEDHSKDLGGHTEEEDGKGHDDDHCEDSCMDLGNDFSRDLCDDPGGDLDDDFREVLSKDHGTDPCSALSHGRNRV